MENRGFGQMAMCQGRVFADSQLRKIWSTSDGGTSRSDCETSQTDCATWIVQLASRIVKLAARIVKLVL